MLSNPYATSVTEVAYSCGFSNLGHFAKDYGRHFGELPSETLNAAKGAAMQIPKQKRNSAD